MLGITGNLDRPAILDSHTHRASVRAIVRAHGASEFSRGVHCRRFVEEAVSGEVSGILLRPSAVSLDGAAKIAFGVESFITVPGSI
jgi:hypothetical protein